jgi:hypothetical protein
MNYIELTIFRILKAQSETESEVSDEYFQEDVSPLNFIIR